MRDSYIFDPNTLQFFEPAATETKSYLPIVIVLIVSDMCIPKIRIRMNVTYLNRNHLNPFIFNAQIKTKKDTLK